MNSGPVVFEIGEARITQLVEIYPWVIEPTDWFPDVTEEQRSFARERYAPSAVFADGSGWISAVRNYVVELAEQVIVVDTCSGNHKSRPHLPELHQLDSDYLDRFIQAGFDPDRVDVVVNTHLHPDHCGWNTRLVDGVWLPSFPNATYIFDAAELEFTRTVGESGVFGELSEDFGLVYEDSVVPILRHAKHELVAAGGEISSFGGTRVVTTPTPGHTPGHLSVEVRAGRAGAFLSGDVLHHPVQVDYPDLQHIGDADPAQAARTRREVLGRCADEGLVLLTAHLATRPDSGLQDLLHVVRDDAGGFAWA